MKSVKKKLLSCVLDDKVLCSRRKLEKSGFMERCFKCREMTRFIEEMDAEEEAFWEEEEKIRKFGYPRSFDVSGES